MKIADFIKENRDAGSPIMALAASIVGLEVEDDPELLAAARLALDAEDNFHELWLERAHREWAIDLEHRDHEEDDDK